MTCLSIIQNTSRRLGLLSPNAAVSSTDPQILQMLALLNEEGQELADRYQWQSLTQEATFTTLASESQGSIATIAPGMKFILNETMWDRSQMIPVRGSISPQRWQQRKASVTTGPYPDYRIRGGLLLMSPPPAAGLNVAFEYVSSNWVSKNAGGTASEWSSDLDTSLLSEQLLTLGLIWRFKEVKGFKYEEDFRKYERQVTDAMARDGSKPVLNANGPAYVWGAGTPEGSWPIP